MAAHHENLEPSGFHRGEYVGYALGSVWRVRRYSKSTWEAVPRDIVASRIYGSTLRSISEQLHALYTKEPARSKTRPRSSRKGLMARKTKKRAETRRQKPRSRYPFAVQVQGPRGGWITVSSFSTSSGAHGAANEILARGRQKARVLHKAYR